MFFISTGEMDVEITDFLLSAHEQDAKVPTDAKVPKTPFSTCSDLENSIIALLETFWPMY